MKNFVQKHPIGSYLIGCFAFTYFFWFLPVFWQLPKDIAFATNLLGGAGPLLAALVVSSIRAKARLRVASWPLFVLFFVLCAAVLLLRVYLQDSSKSNNFFPFLSEIKAWGGFILLIVFAVTAFNISQAANADLRENHIRSFMIERKKWLWYLLALLLIPGIYLSSYAIGAVLKLPLSDYIIKVSPLTAIGFFVVLLMTGGNEEFGWRGFMQKELQKKYNPLLSSFIISFFWSLWHLPLHYSGVYSTGGWVDLLPRFIWLFPITIVFTWLYNRSSYSLLSVCILHAMLNTGNDKFGYSTPLVWILLGCLFVFLIIESKMWQKRTYSS